MVITLLGGLSLPAHAADQSGTCGDIFSAVKEVGANVNMISEGASSVALNFVVPNGDVLPVIKILHKKFVEEGN